MSVNPRDELLARLRREFSAGADLAEDDPWLDLDGEHRTVVPLPSRSATGDLAAASVTAVLRASGDFASTPDPDRIAMAYRSDRILTVDGSAPSVWSPFSGFWRTRDGWVRTHGNYPHHALRLRTGLGLGRSADEVAVRAALGDRTSAEALHDITSAGGLVVAVLPESPPTDAALRERPLVHVGRLGRSPGSARGARPLAEPGLPLSGVRVLDLTRVIAGPVCTRTLALLGADVLRIDPPGFPEPEWQHFDTGHGKRSSVLDARAPLFHHLLSTADVVVLGYRPASLARLGLAPHSLADRHPGLIIAQLSAWGLEFPDRAGFDSLVQAESGIAMVESSDGATPGVLPAQALDHSAGYLLAAAITALIRRRAEAEGSWLVETSLRRVAAELLGMPRRADAGGESVADAASHVASFDVAGIRVTTVRPALPGREFAAPHRWGRDQPRW